MRARVRRYGVIDMDMPTRDVRMRKNGPKTNCDVAPECQPTAAMF